MRARGKIEIHVLFAIYHLQMESKAMNKPTKKRTRTARKSLINGDILVGLRIRTDLRAGDPAGAPTGGSPKSPPPPAPR